MLFDPKWENEVKADPFKLETLIAWLEKQPAHQTYCYTDCGRCLLSQYFNAMGFGDVKISPNYLEYLEGCVPLPDGFDAIAIGPHTTMPTFPAEATGWKFGEALTRARKLLSAQRT